MKSKQLGFAHLGLIIGLLVVIVIIGAVGWKVHKQDSKLSVTENQSKSADNPKVDVAVESEDENKKLPENYIYYENKDIGFKFAYPKEWGSIVRTGDDTSALITDGLNGHALRTVFKDGDANILPRGNYLNGDVDPGTDEGHYGGGYIQKENKYYSIAKYTGEEVEIPSERILTKAQSGLGTVLVINSGTVAGNRIQLLLNLPSGKPLTGLDLVFKNSNEDFADESKLDDIGLETIETVAKTFEAI